MIVLGTPCATVLLPVKVTGPLTTGFILSGLPGRKAISQNNRASATIRGNAIHRLKSWLRFFFCIVKEVAGVEASCNLNSCQSLYPSTDTSACRVDGCGV